MTIANGDEMDDTSMYSLPPTLGRDRHDPTMKRAPAYTFGSRYSRFSDDSPGPAYNVDSTITKYGRERERAAVITGRPLPRVSKDVVPGPVYNTSTTNSPRYKTSPSYSFGYRSFPNFDGPHPGPTKYNIPSTLGYQVVGYRGAQAASIRGRSDKFGFAHDWSGGPGPGAYDASYMRTRRAPVYTFKGRNYMPGYKMVTPGPGAYEPTGKGNNSPRFPFGVKHSRKAIPVFTLADVSD